jgi:Raf kinase inhibitor-like YbhB/YbcL family protein
MKSNDFDSLAAEATPLGTDTGTICPQFLLGTDDPDEAEMTDKNSTFTLTSSAFTQGGSIPAKYTCEGDDLSPPLAWVGAPENTKSFAMIVDDPDAPDPAKPQRVYVHWVLNNIPAGTTALAENATKSGLPTGTTQGKNDFGHQNYGGPCPPIGRHRYFFKLYALDTDLKGLSAPSKPELLKAMEGHILAQAELMGTYQKGSANK